MPDTMELKLIVLSQYSFVQIVFVDEHCLGEEHNDLEAKVESLDNRLIGIEEQLKQAIQTPKKCLLSSTI